VYLIINAVMHTQCAAHYVTLVRNKMRLKHEFMINGGTFVRYTYRYAMLKLHIVIYRRVLSSELIFPSFQPIVYISLRRYIYSAQIDCALLMLRNPQKRIISPSRIFRDFHETRYFLRYKRNAESATR